MATRLGNGGVVKLGNTTIGELRGFSLTETVQIVDDSALTDSADTHLVGSSNWSATVTVAQDVTDAVQANMTVGSEYAFTFWPSGNVSGQPAETGNATIETRGDSVERNTLIVTELTLRGQGALTRGTI